MSVNGFGIAFRERFGFKILSSFITVIIGTLTVYTVIGALREGNRAKATLRAEGEVYAGLLSRTAVVGIFSENRRLLEDAAAGVLAQKDVLAVSMYDEKGSLLYTDDKQGPVNGTADRVKFAGQPAEILTVTEQPDVFEFLSPVRSGAPVARDEALYFGTGGPSERGQVIGYVRVILSKKAYQREVMGLVARNALMMAAFIIASVVIVSLAVKRILRPLANLTATARALEAGLTVPRLTISSRDEIGNLTTAFNAMIEARSKAEESLRESEERYRRLVELSPDAILVLGEGVFLFLNAAAARLLGAADTQELVGTDAADVLPPEDRKRVSERFLQVEREGNPALFLPLRYLRRDGTIADAEAAVAPFPIKTGPSVLVIARDVTDRKALENRIRSYEQELRDAAERMSSLELRVEERERHLIATDLHDFVGQNLVASQFKLGMLKRAISSSEALQQIAEVSELLAQTIMYTRSLTVELSSPVLVEIGLAAAVQSLAEGIGRNHGIDVRVEDDGEPKPVTDEVRYLLFRSVRELLMNVVKHARATTAVVSLSAENGNLRISVRDNGAGFEPAAASGRNGGFGLFAIRERISGIGGACEIESGPGTGTLIRIAAPLRTGKERNSNDNHTSR